MGCLLATLPHQFVKSLRGLCASLFCALCASLWLIADLWTFPHPLRNVTHTSARNSESPINPDWSNGISFALPAV